MSIDSRSFNDARYSGDLQWDTFTTFRIRKALSFIQKGKKVLDVGCFDGSIMQTIEEKGCTAIGVDNAASAVKNCKKKGLNVKLIETVEKLPFKKHTFDTIYAGEIIEHLYDVGSFLNELNRVLKPGGQLVITTPNLTSIGSRLTVMLGKIPWMVNNELNEESAGHLRYFTFNALEDLLDKYGFDTLDKDTDVVSLSTGLYSSAPSVTKKLYSFGRIIIINARKRTDVSNKKGSNKKRS